MSTHRTVAGLPLIAESPSRYRIVTPNLEAARIRSWIIFVGDQPGAGWTIEWDESGRTAISNMRWSSLWHVADYLFGLGTGKVQA